MPKTSDIQLGEKIFALFKGEPKSGKSVAAGSFPGPIYFFDCDGRMKPIKFFYPNRTDITYDTYTVDDYPKFEAKMNQLESRNDYKTVVVDSLTFLADMVLKYSMSLRGRDGGKRKGLIQLYEIEDFGTENSGIMDIIDFMRKLRCHVILTAHVLTTVSEDIIAKKTTISRTLLTGGKKIAAKIPGAFDEIYHFNIESAVGVGKPPKRTVITQSAGADFAGTAMPLPMTLDITDKGLYTVMKEALATKGVVLTE